MRLLGFICCDISLTCHEEMSNDLSDEDNFVEDITGQLKIGKSFTALRDHDASLSIRLALMSVIGCGRDSER